MSSGPCPHCGGNTADDAALERGLWWLHPVTAYRDGTALPLSRAQAKVLYPIARANGIAVRYEQIAPRLAARTIDNHLADIRKALGNLYPVCTIPGVGFAWINT